MEEAEKKDTMATEELQDEKLQVDVKEESPVANEASEECEEKEQSAEEQIICLEKENAELKDQYLRKLADFDNYRKRMIKEKQEAIDYANTNLISDLLTTLDDFDRAIQAASQESNEGEKNTEKKEKKNKQGENSILEGLRLMNKQMLSMLENKYNLQPFGLAGEAYDHDKHEAIGSMQMPVAEPVLAEVYLKGYLLKERVLRPAKVMVHMPDGTKTEE